MLDLNNYKNINAAPKLTITDIYIKESLVDFRGLKNAIDTDIPFQYSDLNESQLKKVEYDSVYQILQLPFKHSRSL